MDSSISWDSYFSFLKILRKVLYFVAVSICDSFPMVYSQNFENGSLKGHLLFKVTLDRVDIGKISLFAPPVNHFYL